MKIDADFYAGNIEHVATTAGEVVLRVRKDTSSDFLQWWYFAVEATDRDPRRLVIENAGRTTVPAGWEGYRAFRATEGDAWQRMRDTAYVDGRLVIDHEPIPGRTRYAYFPPYLEHHEAAFLDACRADGRVSIEPLVVVGPHDTAHLLAVGSAEAGALQIWIVARQHPGEVPASWWVEGFVGALLDRDDADARALLARARVHVVPNMNPDGSRLGNFRTNRHGKNLNASWNAADAATTPAVHTVLERIRRTGIDVALDVHADEELPYVFVAGVDRVLPLPDDLTAIRDRFEDLLAAHDPSFEPRSSYIRAHTTSAPLSFCAPYLMHTFDVPALTLELPCKAFDAGAATEREYGVAGSRATGRASVGALAGVLDVLTNRRALRSR